MEVTFDAPLAAGSELGHKLPADSMTTPPCAAILRRPGIAGEDEFLHRNPGREHNPEEPLRGEMDAPVPITLMPPDVQPTTATGQRRQSLPVSRNRERVPQEPGDPWRRSPGTYGHPPLSLNLHYLMTAYGPTDATDDPDLATQEILGDAMRVLQDFAIVTRDSPYLDPALQNEFERVKVNLQPASLEEFAKIWTAIPQANFRCSVAYNVSVIQIESQQQRRLASAG